MNGKPENIYFHMSRINSKTVVICLLDKEWPPQHSFVDGMLADELAKENNIIVRLFVSYNKNKVMPTRYGAAVCIPSLYKRRGILRFLNFWKVWKLINYQIHKENLRNNHIVLFVRNDPIYLLVASQLRKNVKRLVFQSSFPHEIYSGNKFKRQMAKFLYRLSRFSIDSITGVSPEAVARIRKLFGKNLPGVHIPLLSDLPIYPKLSELSDPVRIKPVFIYIGSHSKKREIETILTAIDLSIKRGANAKFLFIGANDQEQRSLRNIPNVKKLLESGSLRIEHPVPRKEIPSILVECHVGICLIPPKPVYYESSPTKLAEYMGAGLAILANRGIPMQEKFIIESDGGILVDWDVNAIMEGILQLVTEKKLISRLGHNSKYYASHKLQYKEYLEKMKTLISIN